jgi:hypothetical protein
MQLRVEHPAGMATAAVVFVQGSVDGSNYESLIQQGQALYAQGVRSLVLELSECAYMSSSGLVALNALAKLMRGEDLPNTENGWAVLKTLDDARGPASPPQLFLVNPTARVDHVLDLAGLKGMLPVYANTASALAAI